jgi:anti-sigma factor RsiW
MSCEAIRPLLHAHVDGELDLVRELEVERHLATCPSCARTSQNLQALQSALRSLLPPVEAPTRLAARIRAAIRVASPTPSRPLWRRALVPAAAVLVALSAWFLFGPDFVAREVASSHKRFLMSPHYDVESADPAKIRAALEDKLDFKLPVINLADMGFLLQGGRVDFVDERPAAALVYRDGNHTVSLLMWPAKAGSLPQALESTESQGLHLYHWSQGNLNFWAVSDLGGAKLFDFAESVHLRAPNCCH